MTISEFSDQFDVLYNNITSNQAPGLNEYEKSLFLTKAEKEIVKNYFSANSAGNTLKQGFDDSAKRQADFSVLMKTAACAPVTVSGTINITFKKYICYLDSAHSQILRDSQLIFTRLSDNEPVIVPNGTYAISISSGKVVITATIADTSTTVVVTGYPYDDGTLTIADETQVLSSGRIDDRSSVFAFPPDTFIVINESIKTAEGRRLQVIPLRYNEYTNYMSKPFKYPVKNQAWRLMNSGEVNSNNAVKYVEIITNTWDVVGAYNVRYVRVPKPIIVGDMDGLKIDGYEYDASAVCEIRHLRFVRLIPSCMRIFSREL